MMVFSRNQRLRDARKISQQMKSLRNCVKTSEEILGMKTACRAAAKVLRRSKCLITPGISTFELDCQVGQIIDSENAESAFLGYRDFPRQCCISVNEEVIHGIGSSRRLQFGDLVKLDIGVRVDGYIGDVAMSIPVGGCSPAVQKIVDTTASALHCGLSKISDGARIADVSKAIQVRVETDGFSVIREFVGHGVGKKLHEEPQIPNFFEGDKANSQKLLSGMTIAVEPMVNFGGAKIRILSDGWTVVAKDRLVSAHFEHTVLVTDNGFEILTDDGNGLMY